MVVETKNTSLVLNVESNKRVTQSYLGKKLPASEYALLQGGREVYLTAGMENQFEPAIRSVCIDKITFRVTFFAVDGNVGRFASENYFTQ